MAGTVVLHFTRKCTLTLRFAPQRLRKGILIRSVDDDWHSYFDIFPIDFIMTG